MIQFFHKILLRSPKSTHHNFYKQKTPRVWGFCLNPIPLEVNRPVEWGLGNNFYACQTWSHFGHFVGSLSANRATNPIGKKHIATIICHVLKPPFVANSLHFGHDNCDAILFLLFLLVKIKYPRYKYPR